MDEAPPSVLNMDLPKSTIFQTGYKHTIRRQVVHSHATDEARLTLLEGALDRIEIFTEVSP